MHAVPYPVKVVTLSGDIYGFLVRANELVIDLKEKISLTLCITILRQRLLFMQEELLDTNTFQACQIQTGAIIHLVLVTSEIDTQSISYICPAMTPTLSIHHFKMGFGLDQFSDGIQLHSQKSSHPLNLPSHISHIVHVYDAKYTDFRMFLQFIYCRKLNTGIITSMESQDK